MAYKDNVQRLCTQWGIENPIQEHDVPLRSAVFIIDDVELEVDWTHMNRAGRLFLADICHAEGLQIELDQAEKERAAEFFTPALWDDCAFNYRSLVYGLKRGTFVRGVNKTQYDRNVEQQADEMGFVVPPREEDLLIHGVRFPHAEVFDDIIRPADMDPGERLFFQHYGFGKDHVRSGSLLIEDMRDHAIEFFAEHYSKEFPSVVMKGLRTGQGVVELVWKA